MNKNLSIFFLIFLFLTISVVSSRYVLSGKIDKSPKKELGPVTSYISNLSDYEKILELQKLSLMEVLEKNPNLIDSDVVYNEKGEIMYIKGQMIDQDSSSTTIKAVGRSTNVVAKPALNLAFTPQTATLKVANTPAPSPNNTDINHKSNEVANSNQVAASTPSNTPQNSPSPIPTASAKPVAIAYKKTAAPKVVPQKKVESKKTTSEAKPSEVRSEPAKAEVKEVKVEEPKKAEVQEKKEEKEERKEQKEEKKESKENEHKKDKKD